MSPSEHIPAPPADVPEMFGILHRHLPGDDTLLLLAQAMLERAALGAEVYPVTVAEALQDWRYVPRGLRRHIVHLPRHWDILSSDDRGQLIGFARALSGRVRGLVLHDRRDWPERVQALAAAAEDLDRELAAIDGQPTLFFEYAAGLEPEAFLRILEHLAPLRHVSACVDTGHVAIFCAQRSLAERHPHLKAWALDPNDASVAMLARDLDDAAVRANEDVVALVDALARLRKPMHFHLHDGHLLSRLSRYQVCDHLPFGQRIPVTSALASGGSTSAMLGRRGLGRVLHAVRAQLPAADVSLTLEIHPSLALQRRPLGEWAPWFSHWTDLTNAELTHAWLVQVTEQSAEVRELWRESS